MLPSIKNRPSTRPFWRKKPPKANEAELRSEVITIIRWISRHPSVSTPFPLNHRLSLSSAISREKNWEHLRHCNRILSDVCSRCWETVVSRVWSERNPKKVSIFSQSWNKSNFPRRRKWCARSACRSTSSSRPDRCQPDDRTECLQRVRSSDRGHLLQDQGPEIARRMFPLFDLWRLAQESRIFQHQRKVVLWTSRPTGCTRRIPPFSHCAAQFHYGQTVSLSTKVELDDKTNFIWKTLPAEFIHQHLDWRRTLSQRLPPYLLGRWGQSLRRFFLQSIILLTLFHLPIPSSKPTESPLSAKTAVPHRVTSPKIVNPANNPVNNPVSTPIGTPISKTNTSVSWEQNLINSIRL